MLFLQKNFLPPSKANSSLLCVIVETYIHICNFIHLAQYLYFVLSSPPPDCELCEGGIVLYHLCLTNNTQRHTLSREGLNTILFKCKVTQT